MADDRALVLVVDDDVVLRGGILRVVTSMGLAAIGAGDGPEAIAAVETEPVAVAIIDLGLPGMHGFDVLAKIRALKPEVECVILTGTDVTGTEVRARGAADYFQKPITDMDRFHQVIHRACEVFQLRRTVVRLEPKDRPSPIQGTSAATLLVRSLVERMATASAPVLITGESGVGKEVIAEALHQRSGARGEFVRINVAAVPASLIEAELFGAEEGTFTGQRGRRLGLLAAADKGTLFLDEIGDMPLDLQPKILRALQNRAYRPLGAQKEKDVTARIIAATNVDLKRAVTEGRFREDLYFRLAVLKIEMPPLRHRADDIAFLVRYFVRKYANAEGRAAPDVAECTLAALAQHAWPGNVRELANAVQRALVLGVGSTLELVDFGIDAIDVPRKPISADAAFDAYLDLPLADAKEKLLQDFVPTYLRKQLDRSNGNVTRAAEASGLHRPNFRREMRRYSVDREDD